MADGIFNISKGAFAEKIRDTGSKTLILLLKVNEAEAALLDHDNLSVLLGAAGNTEADFTGYVRKTAIVETLTVDDTNDRVDVDIPDQTWTAAGGATNNTLTKLVSAYEEAAADTTRIPSSHHDFSVTTDGSDLTAQINAAGLMRAA
ncbi:MAG TPA: hypothetical protein VLA52_07135 [Thermohalobaculum sp.]|nr:hypothetical protein [Thermohalobaculum sp.]